MTDGSSRAGHLSSDLELGITSQRQETRSGAGPGSPRQGRWGRAQQGLFQGWQSFKGFLLAVCSSRERPLHFIKLQIPSPSGAQHDYSGSRVYSLCIKQSNIVTADNTV